MKIKRNQLLVALTDKFLKMFIEYANKLDGGKPNASFHLNYTLPDVLAQTETLKQRHSEPGFPCPVLGLNFLTELYELEIQEVGNDILYIINNFDKQLLDDRQFTNLKKTPKGYTMTAHSQNVKLKVNVLLEKDGTFKSLTLEDKSEVFHKVENGCWIDIKNLDMRAEILNFPDKLWLHKIRDINEFYLIVFVVKRDIKEEIETEE